MGRARWAIDVIAGRPPQGGDQTIVLYKRSRLAFVVLLVALTVSALTAAPALAAKGGGRGGGSVSSGATLLVSPNPVPANSSYHISGCGYTVGVTVLLNMVQGDGTVAATGAVPGSDGCIGIDWNTNAPGTYTLKAYQQPWGAKLNLVASTTFAVI